MQQCLSGAAASAMQVRGWPWSGSFTCLHLPPTLSTPRKATATVRWGVAPGLLSASVPWGSALLRRRPSPLAAQVIWVPHMAAQPQGPGLCRIIFWRFLLVPKTAVPACSTASLPTGHRTWTSSPLPTSQPGPLQTTLSVFQHHPGPFAPRRPSSLLSPRGLTVALVVCDDITNGMGLSCYPDTQLTALTPHHPSPSHSGLSNLPVPLALSSSLPSACSTLGNAICLHVPVPRPRLPVLTDSLLVICQQALSGFAPLLLAPGHPTVSNYCADLEIRVTYPFNAIQHYLPVWASV